MADHYHYEYAEARHDHRGEFADARHDHDYEYAGKHHRHHDDESTARGLREDLVRAEERIRELEDSLSGALERIGQLEDLRPTCVVCLDAAATRQTTRGPVCSHCAVVSDDEDQADGGAEHDDEVRPHCGARWPNLGPAGDEWECALDAGHEGDHEAHISNGKRAADASAAIPQGHPDILTDDQDDEDQAAEHAPCGCPKKDGVIRHRRAGCTDPIVARLGWYAGDEAEAQPVPRLRPAETGGTPAAQEAPDAP